MHLLRSGQPLRACLLALAACLALLALAAGGADAHAHASRTSVKCAKLHRAHARAACRRHQAALRRRRKARSKHTAKAARAKPASGLNVGLVGNTQGYGGGMGERQDLAASSGARWLREEFDWNVIQPQAGVWDWTRYDQLMTSTAQRGLSVLPLVMATPAWAGSNWNTIPADPSAYATLVAHIVARYGPGGSFWTAHPQLSAHPTGWIELWNEPYFDYFSQGGANPGLYARLVRAAVIAGRAANSRVKFLLQVDVGGNGWSQGKTFLSGMYAAVPNLNDYYDAAAVHPYGDGNDPSIAGDRYGFQNLAAVRAEMVADGAASKPMWITEVGWSTCPAGAAKGCVTEARQTSYMQTVFRLCKTTYRPFVRAIFLYDMQDFGAGEPSNPEQWYGLTRLNGTRKPAFATFAAQAAQSD